MYKRYIKYKKSKIIILISCFLILLNVIWIEVPFWVTEKGNTINNPNFKEDPWKNLKISNDAVISGNWSALIAAGLCTGSGTYQDPYVIKDLNLKGNGSGTGIKIGANKNDYFRIENCNISNFGIGILLYNSNNGTLYRNNCSNNAIGIYMEGYFTGHPSPEIIKYIGCMNNTILENILCNNTNTGIYQSYWGDYNRFIRNTVNYNHKGMYIQGSPANRNKFLDNIINYNDVGLEFQSSYGNISIISGNELKENEENGIILNAVGFNLTHNVMTRSGILFSEGSIEVMSMNYIDTTNTVNDRFVYYYINKSFLNPNDFSNAGQIALVNCPNTFIKNVNLSYSSKGISVCHSQNVTIENCESTNNHIGITLWNTSNCILDRCEFSNNIYGIETKGGSKNNTISKCNINQNSWYGVSLDFYCDNYRILDSEMVNNNWAFRLRLSSHNMLIGNVIKDNFYGIDLWGGSEHNIFYENFFRNNTYHTNGGSSTNKWNCSHIGNYWDNYVGFDDDGDGIGEFPHIIDESPLILDYLPIVDNDPPKIIIYSPKNDESFSDKAPSFNILIIEKYLYKMWYSFDDGINNYYFTENSSIDQVLWNSLPNGSITLKIYALDKAGNTVFEEITIFKRIPGQKRIPSQNYIPIIILSTVIGIISIVAIGLLLLYRKKFKLKELKLDEEGI